MMGVMHHIAHLLLRQLRFVNFGTLFISEVSDDMHFGFMKVREPLMPFL